MQAAISIRRLKPVSVFVPPGAVSWGLIDDQHDRVLGLTHQVAQIRASRRSGCFGILTWPRSPGVRS